MFDKVQKKMEQESDRLYKKQLLRCIPFAHKLLKVILEADLDMGDEKDMDGKKYQEVALTIIKDMMESEIPYVDREFVFQLCLQPVSKVKDLVVNSLSKSYEMAQDKKWGKDMLDLTLRDIHEVLTQK